MTAPSNGTPPTPPDVVILEKNQTVNVKTFAQQSTRVICAHDTRSGSTLFTSYDRLAKDFKQAPLHQLALKCAHISWQALFFMKENYSPSGHSIQVPWLTLHIDMRLPQICQRCLDSFTWAQTATLTYRFVNNEATAIEEDPQSQEDVLILSKTFNLYALVEDEILMAIPPIPRHDICDNDAKIHSNASRKATETTPLVTDKPNPFTILSLLKDNHKLH